MEIAPIIERYTLMINNLLDNLMFNWFKIQVWDPDWEMYEEKTLFRQITRGIASGVLFFIIFIREIFLGGIQTISAITGDGLVKTFKWIYKYEMELKNWDKASKESIAVAVCNGAVYEPELKTK